MEHSKPTIFNYLNYREFLQDCYNYLKEKDKKYSYRFIAMKVGSSSPSWLSDIIKGRINLTENYLNILSNFLNLTDKEALFFKLLVNFDQASSHALKKKYMDEILSSKKLKVDILTKNKFDYFRKWYIPVIREFLFLLPFKGDDFKTVAKSLKPKITLKEAKEAISVLKSLDLVSETTNGLIKPTKNNIKKDASVASAYIPSYHIENMRLAGESIDRFKKEERDISSVTIHLSDEMFAKAKDEIRKVREKLLIFSNASKNNAKVYQCNIQLFPTTIKGE